MKIYCATTNPGKLREFRAGIERLAENRVELEAMPGLKEIPVAEETGTTFDENACQKAVYYSRFTDEFLFAEDSGLEVDALDGAPGVYSARFAGEGASDAENNALLLERIRWQTNRTARYVCVIALARRGKVIGTFRGTVHGEILDEERGSGGFGYDPLFYYPPFGATFGEVPLAEKQKVSHRRRAFEQLLRYLAEMGPDAASGG